MTTKSQQNYINGSLELLQAVVADEVRLSLCGLYLVNEWSSEGVAFQQHTSPKIRVFAADQVARQALEEGVLIADLMMEKKKPKQK